MNINKTNGVTLETVHTHTHTHTHTYLYKKEGYKIFSNKYNLFNN